MAEYPRNALFDAPIDPQFYRYQGTNALYGSPVTPDSRAGRLPGSYGAMSSPAERPSDWAVSSGLAETLSPIGQGYGAGQMAGDAYQAARAGDYGSAAGGGLMAAMAMMTMKKGAAPVAAAERPTGVRAYHASTSDFDAPQAKFSKSNDGLAHGTFLTSSPDHASNYLPNGGNMYAGEMHGTFGRLFDPVSEQPAAVRNALMMSPFVKAAIRRGDFGPNGIDGQQLKVVYDVIAGPRADYKTASAELARLGIDGVEMPNMPRWMGGNESDTVHILFNDQALKNIKKTKVSNGDDPVAGGVGMNALYGDQGQ